MKPVIHKLKNWRGRITGYRATVGAVSAEGKTPAEASANCDRETVRALDRLDRGTLVGFWRGHAYLVAPTVQGWHYWIDTMASHDYRQSGNYDQREACQDAALHHLAQNVWEPSVKDDDDFLVGLPRDVADEIKGWIRFQRAYARLAAQGVPDNECHRLACEEASRLACAS